MKYDAIKKRGEQWVRIRPALQIYDDSGLLRETVEDAWFLTDITEDSVRLKSRDTQYSKVIGLDHIHNYMEDPEGQRTIGTTGTIVMNVQLLLHEGALLAEPVAPPGTPLKVFVRARPRATLMATASRMRAQVDLDRARMQFAGSEAGIRAADQAFAEFPHALEALGEDLRKAGHAIEDFRVRHIQGVYLVRAAGWWMTLYWQRRYSNTLDGAVLIVEQLDGPPRDFAVAVTGYLSRTPNRVWQEKYTYGLAALDTPRWLSTSNPAQSFSTADLAQDILTRLLEKSNPTTF